MKKPYFQAGDFEPCRSPGYLIRRIYHLLMRQADHIVFEDLTFTQWIVLAQLRDGSVTTGADICRNLNHDSGAVTRLLDQLEARGLVERHRIADDRRVAKLQLTAEGRALVKRLSPRVADLWNTLMSDFSHAEIATLMELLSRLHGRLDGMASGCKEKSKGI